MAKKLARRAVLKSSDLAAGGLGSGIAGCGAGGPDAAGRSPILLGRIHHRWRAIRRATLFLLFVSATLACGLKAPGPAMAQLQPGTHGGLFVADDPRAQFRALNTDPDALAWANREDLGAPDPSLSNHYQGLVRNPRTGIAPVFYYTQKQGGGGYLTVVEFGSRQKGGGQLGSNLVGKNIEKPASDTWLRSIRFDGTKSPDKKSPEDRLTVFGGKQLPAYIHPGGMAVVNDVLFVPVDSPVQRVGTKRSGFLEVKKGYLLLFDVRGSNATHPVPLRALPLDQAIDNVAVAKTRDGKKFLIWANGGSGRDVNVYTTTSGNLSDPNLNLNQVQRWQPGPVGRNSGLTGFGAGGRSADSWPTGPEAHQSSTFLRGPDGTLYLIAMRHAGLVIIGVDWADLYKVDESGSQLKLTKMGSRRFTCRSRTTGRICNMAAANNAYVTPGGGLLLYSSPHDDEKATVGGIKNRDIVRMAEFP